MVHGVYLFGLLLSLAGLATLDCRFRLAFWHDARRACLTIVAGVGFYIVWDIAGIWLGIFRRGDSQYILPFEVFSEFPLEEVFFLLLLTYTALLLYTGVNRQWPRT
ncbi:MAG TPA: lycopene cyclase domain-containing protein [Candidatus Saccharimonadales bacterium]|jgi:lycopene cyclase domain-containing protein